MEPTEKKIADLRQELHKVELEVAMKSKSEIIGGVVSSDDFLKSSVGPTVLAKVEVNGVSTNALIDTGSPATIISLDFALDVLAKERPNVEEWMSATRKKFETPEISLLNYGGDRLDLLAQLPIQITQSEYQVDVKASVQKDAPNPLLIGTDVQTALGFHLVKKESDASGLDLITGERLNFDSDKQPTKKEETENEQQEQPSVKKMMCQQVEWFIFLMPPGSLLGIRK